MTTIVWRFTDGKAGHDGQSAGLIRALCTCLDLTCFDLKPTHGGSGFWHWLSGSYRDGVGLPAPDLLIGAGHATHWHLLAAQRRWGGRTVVLMKPSLPLSCFDLCLIPEHDGRFRAANVLSTLGSLNSIRPCHDHATSSGLIMLGGPSRHYRWNDDEILTQIEQLVEERPAKKWLLTTSPRTPESMLRALDGRTDIPCAPCAATGADWLPDRLAEAGEVWVSEDSVSMIYEALTAGVPLGLLKVKRARANRVSAGVDTLVDRGWVGAPGQRQLVAAPSQPLNEAVRCARWITDQWRLAH